MMSGTENAFQNAANLYHEQATAPQKIEALIGLAQVYLRSGDQTKTKQYSEMAWQLYQERRHLIGTVSPFDLYMTFYRILFTQDDTRADSLLLGARHLLSEHAQAFEDQDYRQMFLTNMKSHQDLMCRINIIGGPVK